MGKRLNFTKEYKDLLVSGRKTSTIRIWTQLRKGDRVVVYAGGEEVGVAKVVSVQRKPLSALTDEDAHKDGFQSKRELLKALRKHYGKDLAKANAVFVISFKLRRKAARAL